MSDTRHDTSLVTVSDDAFGRAIQMAVRHLQNHHLTGTFGYGEMPWWDPTSCKEIGEPDSHWVNSKILRQLNDAQLTETVGFEQFQLTENGRQADVRLHAPQAGDFLAARGRERDHSGR